MSEYNPDILQFIWPPRDKQFCEISRDVRANHSIKDAPGKIKLSIRDTQPAERVVALRDMAIEGEAYNSIKGSLQLCIENSGDIATDHLIVVKMGQNQGTREGLTRGEVK